MSIDMDAVRQQLEEERDRLNEEREEIESADSENSQAEETGELSDYDDHIGDAASATFERAKDYALLENIEMMLQKVNRALDKVEDGSYGKCDRCGQEIGEPRLEAMPSATLCLKCQDVEDSI